ncbi:MAG: DnaJ domain-containing protein [Polyangiaceae bacterium]
MAQRNYYSVLGISRSASLDGIRSAFRELVKRCHPDQAGTDGETTFQEVAEAYRVLGDPERRRQYDRGLSRALGYDDPRAQGDASLRSGAVGTHPAVESIFARFFRNFGGADDAPVEPEAIHLEIVLSREQAERGTVVQIAIPVYEQCVHCRGTGDALFDVCAPCGGDGFMESERAVELRLPPQVQDAETFDVPLAALGVSNVFLYVLIRIATRAA